MYRTSVAEIERIKTVLQGANSEEEIRKRIATAFPLSWVRVVKQQPTGWALLMYPVFPLGEEVEIIL